MINNGYQSSLLNELQLPVCRYPESWKGLEWHLLNPGARILATAQSSKLSTGLQYNNKCPISALNIAKMLYISNLIQLSESGASGKIVIVFSHYWKADVQTKTARSY